MPLEFAGKNVLLVDGKSLLPLPNIALSYSSSQMLCYEETSDVFAYLPFSFYLVTFSVECSSFYSFPFA